MKYKFIDKEKIIEFSGYDRITTTGYVYANKVDVMKEFKDLVVEEIPEYNEETQELYSWYENGEVITQKFKVVDKEV
jgi:hypothetical protein